MIFKIERKNNHPKVNRTFSYLVVAEDITQALKRFQYVYGGDAEDQEITIFTAAPLSEYVIYDMVSEWQQRINFKGTIENYLTLVKK